MQIITKESRTDITELTSTEWEDLLPILKSTINRIENSFHPQGFSLVSSVGKEVRGSRQTVFHFHLHVIPEHKGNCGVSYLKRPYYTPTLQEYEKLEKMFFAQEGIVEENNKAIVKLVSRENASDRGHLIITSKEPIKSDINQLDTETWVQMGELFRKSVKEITEKLNAGSLRVCIFLGKIGGLSQEETSWLQIHLVPRYKNKSTESKENIPVSEEILTVVEKLKKVSNQPKNITKKLVVQLENLKITENREQELLDEIQRLKTENEKLKQENQQLKEQQKVQIQIPPN